MDVIHPKKQYSTDKSHTHMSPIVFWNFFLQESYGYELTLGENREGKILSQQHSWGGNETTNKEACSRLNDLQLLALSIY